MPTLYVENVPAALYAALKKRAKREKSSISAEVIAILEQMVPTEAVLKRRREAYERALEISSRSPLNPQLPYQNAEDMIREDRER